MRLSTDAYTHIAHQCEYLTLLPLSLTTHTLRDIALRELHQRREEHRCLIGRLSNRFETDYEDSMEIAIRCLFLLPLAELRTLCEPLSGVYVVLHFYRWDSDRYIETIRSILVFFHQRWGLRFLANRTFGNMITANTWDVIFDHPSMIRESIGCAVRGPTFRALLDRTTPDKLRAMKVAIPDSFASVRVHELLNQVIDAALERRRQATSAENNPIKVN